jgi:hypothetical protein
MIARWADGRPNNPIMSDSVPEQIQKTGIAFQEAPMPRFHFDIVDGVKIMDPVGMDCSEDQARQVAQSIARQIAIDVGPRHARKIVVVDEEGLAVHEEPVQK